jgi:CBS domain containing-hemolysin-like protein
LHRPGAFHHSRIVVYAGNFDHILGYIPVKTLLRELVKGKKLQYKDVLLPIIDVPRTMMISSAMELMKETKHHIAIVRDEFGGMEGIITLEDILEELVGDMWDEKDNPTTEIRKGERRNSYYVNGAMNIDDFYNEMGLDPDKLLPDDYTTVSGWIVDHLGRFAKIGDTFRVGDISVKVTQVDTYTVKEAFVRKIRSPKK